MKFSSIMLIVASTLAPALGSAAPAQLMCEAWKDLPSGAAQDFTFNAVPLPDPTHTELHYKDADVDLSVLGDVTPGGNIIVGIVETNGASAQAVGTLRVELNVGDYFVRCRVK